MQSVRGGGGDPRDSLVGVSVMSVLNSLEK